MPSFPPRNESPFAVAFRLANDYILQIVFRDEANNDEAVVFSQEMAHDFACVMRTHAASELEHTVTDGMFDTLGRLGCDIAKATSHA